jgi:hypothetical protein
MADKYVKCFEALYKKTSSGKINCWQVSCVDYGPVCHKNVSTGHILGKIKTSTKIIEKSSRLGAFDRACSLVQAEFNRKFDRHGYFRTVEEAKSQEVPRKCMLLKDLSLKDIGRLPNSYFPCYGQIKFNGIRGTYNLKDDCIYSRTLKTFDKLVSLKEELKGVCTRNNFSYLDFELYAGGKKINEIVSMVKNGSEKIEAMVFDVPSDKPFNERLKDLNHAENPRVHRVGTEVLGSREAIKDLYDYAERYGCEGIVIRKADGLYKWNNGTTRDDTIYKIKPLISAEFEIIACKSEVRVVDGNKEDLITFICKTGTEVFTWTPANFGVKRRILMYKDYEKDPKGFVKKLPLASLEFREYTHTGKPFHIKSGYLRTIV